MKKNQNGFTIIEVMIVLAIAGLIMLIVFLAVPALQRTARNTQRKNDTGNIASAISNWISNNNGVLPGTETGSFVQATCTSDLSNAVGSIKLGYYTSTGIFCDPSSTTISICSSSGTSSCTTSATQLNTEDVILYEGNVCSGNTATTTGASGRSYVILYEVENGSSGATEQCIEG